MKRKLLIGSKFKMLTILAASQEHKHFLVCRCDCGKIVEIYKYSILDGQKSCGCIKVKYHVESGMKFGKLTAIRLVSSIKNHTGWECLCDCGAIKIVNRTNLGKGNVRSCGCMKATLSGYSSTHPKEYMHDYNVKHYANHKKERIAAATLWKKNNPDKVAANKAKNVLKRRLRHRKYTAEKMVSDPQYRLASNLRRRLGAILRGKIKQGSAVSDLGCSLQELISYIENQFKPGMTWNNWGRYGWHLDHIKPLSSFDLTDRIQFVQACHYTNLQPLWWDENISKSDRC